MNDIDPPMTAIAIGLAFMSVGVLGFIFPSALFDWPTGGMIGLAFMWVGACLICGASGVAVFRGWLRRNAPKA